MMATVSKHNRCGQGTKQGFKVPTCNKSLKRKIRGRGSGQRCDSGCDPDCDPGCRTVTQSTVVTLKRHIASLRSPCYHGDCLQSCCWLHRTTLVMSLAGLASSSIWAAQAWYCTWQLPWPTNRTEAALRTLCLLRMPRVILLYEWGALLCNFWLFLFHS